MTDTDIVTDARTNSVTEKDTATASGGSSISQMGRQPQRGVRTYWHSYCQKLCENDSPPGPANCHED